VLFNQAEKELTRSFTISQSVGDFVHHTQSHIFAGYLKNWEGKFDEALRLESKALIADANQVRDWRIYSDFAQILIHESRHLYAEDDFGFELNDTVYALDSSTIDLCLSLFP
jgi:hypothetical protein